MEWKSETRKLSELIPWERNPRQLTDEQAKHLQESILKFGQVIPYSIGPDNQIYDGHQRQHVMGMMSEYGKHSEVDVRVSERLLTDEERKELVIRLHENTGEWDFDRLANLYDLDELEEWGFDENLLAYLDFDDEEPPEDPGADIDKAEELREKWKVESGQLWQLGEHRVICGDCTDKAVVDRLMGGEKVDMVTDPPYGMNLNTDWSNAVGSLGSIGAKHNTAGKKYDPVVGDDVQFDPSGLFELYTTGEMFLFGADYYAESLPKKNEGSWLVWDKRKESQSEAIGSEFELIWSKRHHKRRMLRHDWFGFLSSDNTSEARNRVHPTQKPTSLIADIIEQWCKNEVIADPFLGSGTTLIACERLNRKCRGVEIEPKYVAVTLERWAEMTGQEPVLIDG